MITTALAVVYSAAHLTVGDFSWLALGLAVIVDSTMLALWIRARRVPPPMPAAMPEGARTQSTWVAGVHAAAAPLLIGAAPVIVRWLSAQDTGSDSTSLGGVPLFAAAFFAFFAVYGWTRVWRLHRTEFAAGRRLYARSGWLSTDEFYVEVATRSPAASSPVSWRAV